MKSPYFDISQPLMEKWKSQLDQLSADKQRLESWLFVQASGVLFVGKTGELIILKKDFFRMPVYDMTRSIGLFCGFWGLRYKVLVDSAHSMKVIIYKADAVERRLQRASKKFLHCYLCYPFGLSATTFLHEVGCRWKRDGRVPHEIGIALGYPLKDVWGFMGFRKCHCQGSCGWQIFGDPQYSMNMRARFDEARKTAVGLLNAA
ncbi:MAG: DUF3793 family protein [Prosthecochloris sp.]|uniref:DUF3793 domain-containing protein n=1 Tax=Prosthecochloris aestuarii (strain DSM 271 / SK 413) TaxID=290512 RepID=B4S5Y3_PROA2|nr:MULTISPECIES: DUF3793 family protein [Prosthecochloris]ACF45634.1 conserved hypothetical protein [Prosthecochloris aestuarii DSM 271]MCW8797864.1 DUF3793 family protein [Prosthecochloris sp.]RDD30840.1 DUF3793 domain-containing protein [Prosthecochloris sp. ZM]